MRFYSKLGVNKMTILNPLNSSTLQPFNPAPLEPLKEGWLWVKLGEVCELIMGQSPPGDTYADKPQGLPFFQGKADFTDYFPKVRVWCTQPIKIAEEGDILISVRAPVGPVNINNLKCCIGRGLTAIRCKDKTINWFIFWYLRSIEAQIALLGSGSTFGAITRDDLISLKIPLPPIEEQKQIAAKLQELMQEVERARNACEKQLEATKALPSAYLREIFESEEAKKWERKRLGEVCEIIMGQSPPGPTYNKEKVGLIFFQGKIDFGSIFPIPSTWCSEPIKIAQPNDVLISVRAPVGPTNMANQNCCIGRGLAAIRANSNIEQWFVLYFFRFVEKNLSEIYGGRGSTFGAMNKEHLLNLVIPFPSLPVQQRVAAEIKEKMVEVEKLRTSVQKQLEAINTLPQTILRKAFRDEL